MEDCYWVQLLPTHLYKNVFEPRRYELNIEGFHSHNTVLCPYVYTFLGSLQISRNLARIIRRELNRTLFGGMVEYCTSTSSSNNSSRYFTEIHNVDYETNEKSSCYTGSVKYSCYAKRKSRQLVNYRFRKKFKFRRKSLTTRSCTSDVYLTNVNDKLMEITEETSDNDDDITKYEVFVKVSPSGCSYYTEDPDFYTHTFTIQGIFNYTYEIKRVNPSIKNAIPAAQLSAETSGLERKTRNGDIEYALKDIYKTFEEYKRQQGINKISLEIPEKSTLTKNDIDNVDSILKSIRENFEWIVHAMLLIFLCYVVMQMMYLLC